MTFIVFEGSEGSGKSTQIDLLFKYFCTQNKKTLKTFEPGGTPLAQEIRGVFKKIRTCEDLPTPLTELLLVLACRNQHLTRVIKPALQQGGVILCDRFQDSTYVYQGIRAGLSKEQIDLIAKTVLQDLIPDLTFVLDVSINIALSRIKDRIPDRLDSAEIYVHKQIVEGYKQIVTQEWTYPYGKIPKRILIDANSAPEVIHSQILKIVKKELCTYKS